MTVSTWRISYIIVTCLLIIMPGIIPLTAAARLDLLVFRPAEEFTTNNRELIAEGVIQYSGTQRIAVSVDTPAGVSDLGALDETLQTLVVDLGSSYSLTTLVIFPVVENGLSLGPRVVNLSFSQDGHSYTDRGIFNSSSGMEQTDGHADRRADVARRGPYSAASGSSLPSAPLP